jgi:hypothetical protein
MLPIARVRGTWSSTPSALQESKTDLWCPPLQKRKDGAASVVVIPGAEAAKVGQPHVADTNPRGLARASALRKSALSCLPPLGRHRLATYGQEGKVGIHGARI